MKRGKRDEKERRERALESKGKLVREGSGRALAPRPIPQMISLRLDPDVLAVLRDTAEREGTTISDLLRQGAALIVRMATTTPYQVRFSFGHSTSWRAALHGETSSSGQPRGDLEAVG